MAEPIDFAESMDAFPAPIIHGKQSFRLPYYKAEDDDGHLTTCWHLSPVELDEVMLTACIWLHVLAESHPSVWISGVSPFVR